ncbi:rhotekin-2 isoform X1 [Pantherophis guttatus]|uniref:Rhotekin-2 isoform X1 n=1 Tax=Pantherophis guttatus TaxID=94885 RepID=A0A6P9DJ57_PANGU|nr:rhotekin-2 isoform X1 [Pantherophis guttatus]
MLELRRSPASWGEGGRETRVCGLSGSAPLTLSPSAFGAPQEQLEMETRMRDGLRKLLAASTSRDQALRAAKALALCNGRLRGLRAEFRRRSEESAGRGSDVAAKDREACRGKVGISDLRIPLMWKNSHHFNSKDRSERYSVFCLFKMGAQVYDSDLLIVDKAATDICLENATIFEGAGPDFQLKVEVYSCCCGEDPLTFTNTPRKLVKKLKNSLGKSTGKKFSSALDQSDVETLLLTETATHGVNYSLLASASLSLENAKDAFNAHSLTLLGNEDSPSWLPLYGTMCCRLVAQPDCMTQDAMTGFLNEQPSGGVPGETWRRRYCVLRGGQLLCFSAPKEREADAEPALSVPINRETHIRPVDEEAGKKANLFSVINPEPGEDTARIFQAESQQDLCKWMEAFSQHFFDFSQWKHCCEEFMRMETGSPQKPPLFLAKEATSVYQELSIDSPVKPDPLVATAQREEEEESRAALFVGPDEADVSSGSSLKRSESSPRRSRDSEGTSKGREPSSRP